jgi:hypothetical protein
MNEYKAIEDYPNDDGKLSIFLAGTIDNGDSEDWQKQLTQKLMPYDVNVFNPRRDNWNPNATVDDLKDQINWEMDALENAKMIIMYITPTSISPISLLELGLYSKKPIVVCCPEGFWRKTNVDVVCERYEIPLFDDKDKFFDRIIGFVKQETGFIDKVISKSPLPRRKRKKLSSKEKRKTRILKSIKQKKTSR